MSEIWASLQSKVRAEIKDSGLLRAVFGDIEFLELAEDNQLQTLKLALPSTLSLGIARGDLHEVIHQELVRQLQRSDVQVTFETSKIQTESQQLRAPIEPEDIEEHLRLPQIEFKAKWFLNADYKLEYFVNGEHSDFAYKCVEMLSAAPLPHLRQLFIFGPSGMGKTHLLHALGWQIKSRSPELQVKVFSADEFINDYHMYLAKKQMAEFRGKYRLKTDVLLIDDIHSMARAKGAQEELFNIFNYYEQTAKFIAFTCDKSPQTLEGFEPRLLTRFQGGLSAEIHATDFATRLEILESKQERYSFKISREILQQLANGVTNSVRSLEGALFKVGTYQMMKGSLITTAELGRLMPTLVCDKSAVTIDTILAETAQAAGLKVSDLKSMSRRREIVVARNLGMARLREELSLSFAEIGRIFGKDHSTVMNGIKRHKA